MSDITILEKYQFEKLLNMRKGFLLNFSDKTLQEFTTKSVGINIKDDKYKGRSVSKANRIRTFWEKESNFVVAKLMFDLCQYWKKLKTVSNTNITQEEQNLYIDCLNTCKRLVNSVFVDEAFADRVEVSVKSNLD